MHKVDIFTYERVDPSYVISLTGEIKGNIKKGDGSKVALRVFLMYKPLDPFSI